MDSMIDRVAREICLTMWGGYPVEESGREQWSQWEVGRNLARVVIKAMREPTEAMIAYADSVTRSDSDNLQCPDFYRAAIDAALKEQEEKQA